ncbi:MAG: hypothetical protein ABFC96_05755, partial [Thermoguttaceae bacterium]
RVRAVELRPLSLRERVRVRAVELRPLSLRERVRAVGTAIAFVLPSPPASLPKGEGRRPQRARPPVAALWRARARIAA